MAAVVGVVGSVDCDVCLVRVAASGHGDIQVFACSSGCDENGAGVDGDALGAVRGDCVGQLSETPW